MPDSFSMIDTERQTLRQQRTEPVLDGLHDWLEQHMHLVPPQSALGKAMGYLHKQWRKLVVYATDGRLRIDNNLVENSIRPFVIGRKTSCSAIPLMVRMPVRTYTA